MTEETQEEERLDWRGYLPALAIAFVCAVLFTMPFEWMRFFPPEEFAGQQWVGFAAYDVPTYYANSQELFTGGGGLLYANPYDLSEDPAHVYFHLFTMIKGHFGHWLGLTPAFQEPFWRIVVGTLFLFLLDPLAATFISFNGRRLYRRFVHLFLCVGGGITAASTLFPALNYILTAENAPGFFEVWSAMFLSMEESRRYGLWLMSMSRNFIFTGELFYHALFIATTLFFLKQKWKVAVSLFAVTWLTHPFTAVQLGTILHAWLFLEMVLKRDFRNKGAVLLGSIFAIQIIGLLYYKVILGQYDVHTEVEANFKLPVSIDIATTAPWNLFFAYGLLVPIVIAFFATAQGRRAFFEEAPIRYATTGGLITFLLSIHNVFPFVEKPIQPLHFTRGYLWLFLALISLRAAAAWFPDGLAVGGKRIRPILLALFLIQTADTAFFFMLYPVAGWKKWNAIPYIQNETAAMLEEINDLPPSRVMTMEASPTSGMGYLLPTFTDHRTVLAHGCNTPFLQERSNRVSSFYADGNQQYLDGVTVLLVDQQFINHSDLENLYSESLIGFSLHFANPRWIVYTRD